MHENYNHKTKLNDIALVFVDKPFSKTKTFEPVKLSDSDPVDNEICHAGK